MQVLRYEKPERNGDGMECIDLKHTDTINTNVLFPAQLMGGGEICGLNWRYARKLTEGVNTFCSAFRRLTYFRGKLVAEKENRPLESV